MSPRGVGTDEHEAFERPRRRTRPRTKDRPSYADAELGMVVAVDRGRFHTLMDDRVVIATKARQLGRTGVIVGDRVRVVGDTSAAEGTLARIVEVAERDTVLRRTADDDDPYERPIVANAPKSVYRNGDVLPPPMRARMFFATRAPICFAAGATPGTARPPRRAARGRSTRSTGAAPPSDP